MDYLIKNASIITPAGVIIHKCIGIEGKNIKGVYDDSVDYQADHTIDAGGYLISPGFIDIHTHGAGGKDVSTHGVEALVAMSQMLVTHGITAFCPTTMAMSQTRINQLIRELSRNKQTLPGAQSLGLHLEGPYLNKEYPGGNDPNELRLPNPDEYETWSAQDVRLVTVAPELPGAMACIEHLTQKGITCAMGHSNAAYAAAQQAFTAGANQTTHLFNCMAGLHHRRAGLASFTLLEKGCYAQVICEAHLLNPATVGLIAACKSWQGIILVSDATAETGLADGEHTINGATVHIKNGISFFPDGSFANSTLTLDQAVRNLSAYAHIPIWQAALCASYNPARALGLYPQKGSLQAGAHADLVFLDSAGYVQRVMAAGVLQDIL